MLSLSGLCYEIEKRKYCDSLDYTFEKGLLYGIMCLSEEEASVLLKLLAGIYTPDTGSVTIEEINVHSTDTRDIQKLKGRSAYVFDRLGLISNLSILENLLLPYNFVFPELAVEEKLEKIKSYLDLFSIPESTLTMRPAKLNAQTYKLIIIIRSYIIEPDIIFYDMPFTDLEIAAKKKLIEEITLIREKGKTTQIFYSNSDVLFDRADKCIIFNQGRFISEGPWEELILNEDEFVRKIVTNYLSIGLNETEI